MLPGLTAAAVVAALAFLAWALTLRSQLSASRATTSDDAIEVAPAPIAEHALVPSDAPGGLGGQLVRALDSLNFGVIMCDDGGNEAFVNKWAIDLLGATDELVLVRTVIEEVTNIALAGRAATREFELFGPPGRVYLIRGVPLDHGGSFVSTEDITEARRLDQVRRDFVANISHELKTPVGAIALLVETMLEEDDDEVAARLASRLGSEADRMGRTIDDLLELSRIEFGEETDIEAFEIANVVNEAIDRILVVADSRSVSISTSIEQNPFVDGDRRQLTSAIYNLLDNAVKYSPDDSEVGVTVTSSDQQVTIAIRDTGIGIPKRDLSRVFERFYRVDRARSRSTGGTGLGLAIVRHVVINHGGAVSVDSAEGRGSTFSLELPLKDVRT